MLLKRTTLLRQPEKEKVSSLGNYVAVRSETNDWFMCVISEINDPSKEAKVVPKVSNISQMLHTIH